MSDDAGRVLLRHVERFNRAVVTGDYRPMLDGFAPDAEMVFEGVPVGPFAGRNAIAAAYRDRPPDDEILLIGAVSVSGDVAECEYGWARDRTPAGRMIVTAHEGAITRLVVTFESDG
jgi:steroid delta-isomerase